MRRTNCSEVPPVESCQLRLGEALEESDDARIHDSETEVGIRRLKGSAPPEILGVRVLDAIGAVDDIVHEREPRFQTQAFVAPVVELRQDETGDDEAFVGCLEQLGAAIVIGIGCVERRQERPCVEDEGHAGQSSPDGECDTGSLVSSAADLPSVELATPTRGRRAARMAAAFSSTASANTTESGTPLRRASAWRVASDSSRAVTVVRRIGLMMRDAISSDRR